MNDLAQGMAFRAIAPEVTHLTTETSARTAEFDASRVFDNEPVDPFKVMNAVGTCRADTGALGILLAESKRKLQESVYFCNQKAWGYWDTDVGSPTPEQATELLERMDVRFEEHARAAHELRALCAAASDALEKAKAKAFEEMNARSA